VPARKRALILGALGVGVLAGWVRAAGAEVRIDVLISQDAEPYQQALEGFRRAFDQAGVKAAIEVFPLHGSADAAGSALQHARQSEAGLILTLGSLATQAAVRQVTDTPIVAGLILNADDLGKAPNATGVVLEFPVETEFQWLQRVLPGQKTIGVLFNPIENQGRIDAAAKAARSVGLTLQAHKVDSPRELPDALDSLTHRADVLWGVADRVVLNPQTVKPILLFSIRNRIPFIGLSQTWVKAGALYALDRDYADIGMQCAELAGKILQGEPPRALPPVPPRKVTYSVNLRTARLLKLEIEPGLLRGAQSVIN